MLDGFDPAAESIVEADAGRVFCAADLELEQQVEICDGASMIARLDFADRKRKIAVEIDGLSFHSGYDALTNDRRRDRLLQRVGWTVLRFTADDVRLRPQRMVEEMKAQIAHIDRRRR